MPSHQMSVKLLVFLAELHLYEGFIGRQEERSVWKTGLQFIGLNKPEAEHVADDWQLSARHLLDRIFQKWSPSEKASTDNLCENLKHFNNSLGSADRRVYFSDYSQPPPIMVGEEKKQKNRFQSICSFGSWVHKGPLYSQVSELITEILIRILKAEPKDDVPGSVRKASPLIVGLSVFMITRKLGINLGVKGWAELCLLLSSTDNRSLEESSVCFPNAQQ